MYLKKKKLTKIICRVNIGTRRVERGGGEGGKGSGEGNERKEQTAKTNAIKQIRFFLLKSFNERASSLIEAR